MGEILLGSHMEGLFVFFIYLLLSKILKSFFFPFLLNWNLRKWYDNVTILQNARRHMKTSLSNTLWKDSWNTAPHIANWLSNHVSIQTPVTAEETNEGLKMTLSSWKSLLCLKTGTSFNYACKADDSRKKNYNYFK